MRGEPFVMQATSVIGDFNLGLRFVGTIKIDWGDGTSNVYSNAVLQDRIFTHTYVEEFTSQIRIIGSLNRITRFASYNNATALVTIEIAEYNKFKNLEELHTNRANYYHTGNLDDLVLPNLQTATIGRMSGTINPFNTSLTFIWVFSATVGQFPEELLNLKNLQLAGSCTYIGSYIPQYSSLETLWLQGTNTLSAIPVISTLLSIDVRGQNTVSSIPNGLTNLENIRVEGNNTISTLPSIVESPKLKTIYLIGQNTVTSVPAYPDLDLLYLRSANNILPTLPPAPKLTNLTLTEFTGNTLPDYPLARTIIIFKSSITTIEGSTYINMGTVGSGSIGEFRLFNNTGLVYDFADFGGTPRILEVYNTGGVVTYSGGMPFRPDIQVFHIYANLSSTEVDLFFIELDASGTVPTPGATSSIKFLGEAAAPTSASTTARTNLTAKGFVVQHN